METMKGLKRSAMCGAFSAKDIGKTVTVMGWVQKVRNLGSMIFIDLRDRSGVVQVKIEDTNKDVYEKAAGVRMEFVLAATGTVQGRGEGAVNKNMKTGEIEVIAEELRILSESEVPPFVVADEATAKDDLRLKHRYLDLRRRPLQQNLMLRHNVCKIARRYFDENGFLEIETPILTKSTPEGARDYLVPSRVHPGSFYALPQSPQLYKQLLMLAGMDRYMQIAKCFRDEDLRADRQPEFTQIDLEMSFVDEDDVMALNEGFLKELFSEVLGVEVQTPFLRMPYAEAMDRFGSDKPDTRFGVEIQNITEIVKNSEFSAFSGAVAAGGSVRAILAPGSFPRKQLDALTEHARLYKAGGLAWISLAGGEVKSPIAKFLTEGELSGIVEKMGAKDGETILIVADEKNSVVCTALGALRLEVAKRLDLIDKNAYNLLWVTDFPLLEFSEEEGRYVAMHHPFTMPKEEDLPLLSSDPGKVRAKAYDIILNGVELGGGSIRIFNTKLQEKMFEVLGFTPEQAWERFGFLLEAFQYGTPPHGGMAYGLDRLVMLLCGSDSIRDTIAFPKVQNASELMNGAPSGVDEKQLRELGIALIKQDEA